MKDEQGTMPTRLLRTGLAASGLAMLCTSLLSTAPARAQEQAAPCPCFWHRHHKQGTRPPGKPRWIPHTEERAGYPRELARHLESSVTAGGIGYYVGGGAHHGRAEPRYRDEGTWGWDETGCRMLRRCNILGWSHGRRYQGGTGSYATDGRPLPDVAYGAASLRNSFGGGSH
jgi:hypothetical protein